MNKEERFRAAVNASYPEGFPKGIYHTPPSKIVTYALNYLADDEIPEAVLLAVHPAVVEPGGAGALWLTDKRLFYAGFTHLILKKPLFEEYAFDKIASVQLLLKTSFTLAGKIYTIKLSYSGGTREFIGSGGPHIQDFVERIQAKERQPKSLQPSSLTEQLQQLTELKKQGVLTESEFKAAKAKLLK